MQSKSDCNKGTGSAGQERFQKMEPFFSFEKQTGQKIPHGCILGVPVPYHLW